MTINELTNPGTPTRLAKQIRFVTRRIIECEASRSFVPEKGSDELTLTDSQYEELENTLDSLLAKRTYLIESLIGYLANDEFIQEYITFSKRNNVPASASLAVRKNIKACQKVYNDKVSKSKQVINDV